MDMREQRGILRSYKCFHFPVAAVVPLVKNPAALERSALPGAGAVALLRDPAAELEALAPECANVWLRLPSIGVEHSYGCIWLGGQLQGVEAGLTARGVPARARVGFRLFGQTFARSDVREVAGECAWELLTDYGEARRVVEAHRERASIERRPPWVIDALDPSNLGTDGLQAWSIRPLDWRITFAL
jgi:hypothetical protein